MSENDPANLRLCEAFYIYLESASRVLLNRVTQ